jgi:adenosyl cobinamide kinase/adenosyl cobinamide phosphate guanylyltransferase
VAALPEKYSRLIEAIYFKHMKWETIESEQHICKKTIANHRRKALELLKDLCDWYNNMMQLDED